MKQLEKLFGRSYRDFFSVYRERKHLFIPSASSNHFDEALELSDIETYLATVPLKHGQIVLVNHQRRPLAEEFLKIDNDYVAGNIIDIRKLLSLLSNGTTAILTDMARYIPKLNRYCEQLENELGVKLQANVYITPPKSRGFNVHIDSHDVLVLQIYGKKIWHLFGGLVEYPTKSFIRKQKEFTEKDHPLVDDIEMVPGDLLYVPQGMYHDASTDEAPSIHITLGLLQRRRSEILKTLLDHASDHAFLRQPIPRNLKDPSVKEVFYKEFKETCHKLIEEADLEVLLDEIQKEFGTRQVPDLQGTLSATLTIDQLTIDSIVKKKKGVRYRVNDELWHTAIYFCHEQVKIPKPIESVLNVILGDEVFSVKDISPDLSEKVKIELIKEFVIKGLLQVVAVPT
ncbi:JmjC domain-containing protein [Roseivirga sp. E12]|uniref:JmjC domain-containing protein n=1 Tax=Roseivirga sp. E12 TaxID=2819237 RepID=UPI001ABC58EB|nr:cupin domain-containing protein [Roseivirga sp. E12]MBO3699063.1 hypothetical protein [Roseivirga sp. E12]